MFSRRCFHVGAIAFVGCALAQSFVAAQQVATLEEQLRATLKLRRPEEFEFIAKVVVLVNDDKLPKDLVLSIMHYARKKHEKYPFPWFEKGVRLKAIELGVEL